MCADIWGMELEITVNNNLPVEVEGNSANIFIFGEIHEWWGYSEMDMVKVLKNKNLSELNLYINSDGGKLSTAFVIHDLLKGSNIKVTAYLLGYVASSATIIACAADKIVMSKQCLYLAHKPMISTYSQNSDELRETADQLEIWENIIVDMYKRKTGLENEEILSLMKENIFIDPETTLEMGFVDELADSITIDWSIPTSGDSEFNWRTSDNHIWDSSSDSKLVMNGQSSYQNAVYNCVKKGMSLKKNNSDMSIVDQIVASLKKAGVFAKGKEEDAKTALSAENIVSNIIKDVKAKLDEEGGDEEGGDSFSGDQLLEAVKGMDEEQLSSLREQLGFEEGGDGEGGDGADETQNKIDSLTKDMNNLSDTIAQLKSGGSKGSPKPKSNGKNDVDDKTGDKDEVNGTWSPSQIHNMLAALDSGNITESVFKDTTGLSSTAARKQNK